MRRFSRILPIAVWGSVAVSGASLLAGQLDQQQVRSAVLQRFDENRNDKLEPLEARQARTRLKNLLEDNSTREINIFTWRDDLKELLQSLDQDGDNRLSPDERDAGVSLLEKLIPKVEMPGSVKEKEKVKDSERSRPSSLGASNFGATRDRNRGNRGNGYSDGYRAGYAGGYGNGAARSSMGGGMGGGGFGMGYSGNNSGTSYSGSGSSIGGGGNSGIGNGTGGSRRGFAGSDGLYEPIGPGNGVPASAPPDPRSLIRYGQTEGTIRERPQKPGSGSATNGGSEKPLDPLTDTPQRPGLAGGGTTEAGAAPNSPPGKPGGAAPPPPDGLGGPGAGLTPPTGTSPPPKPAGSGTPSAPILTPPIPKPNF